MLWAIIVLLLFIVLSFPEAYRQSKRDAEKFNRIYDKNPERLSNYIQEKINKDK